MVGTGFAETTQKGPRMWQGQVWEARPDREQRVARQSLERGMEAASGRRELRNTKASPREGEETAENPLPHTMCRTPHWASAGRVAFYLLCFLKRRKCIRGHFLVVFGIRSGPSQGSPASAGTSAVRACVGRYVNQNARFPDLALRRRCCLGW